MSFKRKVQEIKREMLLEEATNLFIRDGYENMKIADLAKNTGVSVGAIYAMFGSKEGIYHNYILGQIEYYIGIMEEQINTCSDPKEMLTTITKIKFSAIIKNKNAIKENFADPTFYLTLSIDEDDPLMCMHRYIEQTIMEPLSKIVQTDKDPWEMFFLFDGLSFGVIKHCFITGGDLMSRVEETVESFLRAIRTN
ncbi:transcriptional regulator, TetR family (plasmid) [Sulfuricurvum kujiense DSM 16994]|uniref:Transcriptional regulator, TetR family n=1 Tax=Sulfuricurvum kujiense (strain ATCC BAA-921 / DSM 16994 / JCM 11577 / YK-1) TaxID=709032 RepID=E4U3P7_SULKY|nr:TetR/AcrR family transcriptional regulator [Sulfuricurvum kujiense]ADR35313.1 transcriptional regulator, TetR family [Sulfuricurvum kujiense DSM 16994]